MSFFANRTFQLVALWLALAAASCGHDQPGNPLPDANPGVDSCVATCLDHATVWISGLEADTSYRLVAVTATETIECLVETTDRLQMTCGDSSFTSSRLDEAHVTFDGTPAEIAVTVTRGDATVANETVTPEYQTSNVCGTECQIAEVTVVVSP